LTESGRILEIAELSVVKSGVRLLDRFSLALEAGETVVVLGEAGSGKDALFHVLGNFSEKSETVSGTLRFVGGEAHPASRHVRPPIRIAYLPSPLSRPFAPHASLASQLSRIVASKLGAPIGSGHEELRLALERLLGAPQLSALNAKPGQIDPVSTAWGLLAAVTAQTPDLVLADHAMADLGPTAVRALLTALAEEKKRLGFALLYITGGLQPPALLGGRVIVIRDGRIVEEGDAVRLMSGHAHAYTRTLFRALPRLSLDQPKVHSAARGQPLLQVHGLDLHADNPNRVRDSLTFELRRGASLALVGESGSGRRALMRVLLGLDRAPSGRVVFDAVDLNVLSETMKLRIRRRVAFIEGGDEALDPRMTIEDAVGEPLRAHLKLSNDLIADYRQSALTRVGLASHDGRRLVSTLSAFDKRRLQVARAIVSAPLLVVVDDPLRGLDAFAQTIMREVLTDFRAFQGPAFLVITSDFTVAQALADEAMVFEGGKVVERGPIVDILRAPRHPASRALIEAVTLSEPDLSPDPASV
jgi:ABC-type glutathione transport system ATPase component